MSIECQGFLSLVIFGIHACEYKGQTSLKHQIINILDVTHMVSILNFCLFL